MTQQAVQGESREDQSRDEKDGGQGPAWAGWTDIHAVNQPTMKNRIGKDINIQ